MKKLLFVVCSILVIAACKQEKDGAFEVTGAIKNAPGRKVLLMELPVAASNAVVLDSAMLDNKGSFALQGTANEEGVYYLVLDKGPYVVLINDSKHIKVNLDVNDYRHYAVEGSPASESLHELLEDYSKKDSVFLASFKQLDSLQKQPGNDSLVTVIKNKRDKELEDLNNTIKNYINESSSSAATCYAISLAKNTLTADQLKPIIDQSVAKFKNHSGLLAIQKIIDGQSSGEPRYSLLNQPAPEISMPDVNGKMVNLSDFKGKFVLVDFWASWCAPCRAENPNVVAAYNKFKDKNFTILGVSLDEDKAAWQQAIAKDKLTWTHISDLKMWESAAVPAYSIEGIPFNVLLNPQGKIIASGLRGEQLFTRLQEVLK